MTAFRRALLDRGFATREDVEALEQWPPYKGCSLPERVYRAGLVGDAQVIQTFTGLGAVDGTADLLGRSPRPAALGALSRALADRHRSVPLRLDKSRLTVGMLDPSDTQAIEKITFYCGLAVEPRAIRPRVLFQALSDAYGVPLVLPDGAFLAARAQAKESGAQMPSLAPDDAELLPAPSPDTQPRTFVDNAVMKRPADPAWSPLARGLARATGMDDDDVRTGETDLSQFMLKDTRPARTASVSDTQLNEIRKFFPGSPLEARDSLPPQVLRVLVPPFRSAVLFLVRGDVAVGWDGKTPSRGRAEIRDTLLPLTAPSALERALAWQRVAPGNPADPTVTERMLFRAIGESVPASFAVIPIVVGDAPTALLYVDRAEGMIDDALVDGARRAGTTLADGLAPFVAAGTLFPPVRNDKLKPITP